MNTQRHTNRARWTRRLAPVVLLAAIGLGCDDDDGGGRADLGGSWTAFEGGDWVAAESGFLDAIAGDGGHAEAWVGLGWTRALKQVDPEQPQDMREGVLDAFRTADRLQVGCVDAWAGLAHFHSSQADTVAALEWSLDVLDLAGNDYVFAHRTDVTGRGLRAIAALNLVKLGRLDEALLQLQAVFPGWAPDPAGDETAQLLAKIGEL